MLLVDSVLLFRCCLVSSSPRALCPTHARLPLEHAVEESHPATLHPAACCDCGTAAAGSGRLGRSVGPSYYMTSHTLHFSTRYPSHLFYLVYIVTFNIIDRSCVCEGRGGRRGAAPNREPRAYVPTCVRACVCVLSPGPLACAGEGGAREASVGRRRKAATARPAASCQGWR
jgi:hypothetical protein